MDFVKENQYNTRVILNKSRGEIVQNREKTAIFDNFPPKKL